MHRHAIVVGLAITACHEAEDPLSASVVAELMRTRGDAEGVARSGAYDMAVLPGECDCPYWGTVDLCVAFANVSPGGPFPLDVVEGDGVLLMRANQLMSFEFVGPIDDDGSFAVGAVARLSTPVSQGSDVWRLDGEFEHVPAGPGTPQRDRFSGELVRRFKSKLTRQLEGTTEKVDADCGAHYPVEGQRLGF